MSKHLKISCRNVFKCHPLVEPTIMIWKCYIAASRKVWDEVQRWDDEAKPLFTSEGCVDIRLPQSKTFFILKQSYSGKVWTCFGNFWSQGEMKISFHSLTFKKVNNGGKSLGIALYLCQEDVHFCGCNFLFLFCLILCFPLIWFEWISQRLWLNRSGKFGIWRVAGE